MPRHRKQPTAGWFDLAKKVANEFVNPQSKMRSTVSVRDNYNPRVRDFLRDYGSFTITSMMIVRAPVGSAILKALNFVSLGAFEAEMKRANYDSMFHLGLVCTFKDGNDNSKRYVFEKTAVIEVKPFKQVAGMETQVVQVPRGVTINAMMDKAQQMAGDKFFKYDAFTNNCQVFVRGLLQAAGAWGEKQSEFVMQPVEALLRAQPGWTAAVARGATDLGAVIDHVVHGSALERTLWQLKQEGYMPNF
jgi:hypothetical protein